MLRAQLAIIPGAVIGSLVIVGVGLASAGWTLTPGSGQAEGADVVLPVEAALAAPVEGENPSEVDCRVSSNYPPNVHQWCGLITQVAAEFDLDPDLIAAVMLQESGGDPDIISVSGAVGLLQVMPRDGVAAKFECINGPCFAARPTMEELTDPEFNLRYGARMLSGLFERSGDWGEALMHYGPMDVGYHYADLVLEIYHSIGQPTWQGG